MDKKIGLIFYKHNCKERAKVYDVPRTQDVGLPTQVRFNVGQVLQPIVGSIMDNRLRRWPNSNWVFCTLCAAPQQTGGLRPMLFQCWSTIFALYLNIIGWSFRVCWDCGNAMRVTLSSPVAGKSTTQIPYQCWCNAGLPSATLSQHYTNLTPLSSNHVYHHEYFFLTLFKHATIWPSYLKRLFDLFDCSSEMLTVSHTQ